MEATDPQEALVRAARSAGVRDERVLGAVRSVPRAWFVPDRAREFVDADEPIRIGQGQTTSQPSLIAKILEDLELTPGTRVLEVGTGFGYEAALACFLVAPDGFVVTIERDELLADEARRRVAQLPSVVPGGRCDIRVRTGDGILGAPDAAPFDAIIVAAAAATVPQALLDQLADGGRMLIPVEDGWGERLLRYERHGSSVEPVRSLGDVRYVPLRPGISHAGAGPRLGRFSRNTLH